MKVCCGKWISVSRVPAYDAARVEQVRPATWNVPSSPRSELHRRTCFELASGFTMLLAATPMGSLDDTNAAHPRLV
jgi:hypothetical protein